MKVPITRAALGIAAFLIIAILTNANGHTKQQNSNTRVVLKWAIPSLIFDFPAECNG